MVHFGLYRTSTRPLQLYKTSTRPLQLPVTPRRAARRLRLWVTLGTLGGPCQTRITRDSIWKGHHLRGARAILVWKGHRLRGACVILVLEGPSPARRTRDSGLAGPAPTARREAPSPSSRAWSRGIPGAPSPIPFARGLRQRLRQRQRAEPRRTRARRDAGSQGLPARAYGAARSAIFRARRLRWRW